MPILYTSTGTSWEKGAQGVHLFSRIPDEKSGILSVITAKTPEAHAFATVTLSRTSSTELEVNTTRPEPNGGKKGETQRSGAKMKGAEISSVLQNVLDYCIKENEKYAPRITLKIYVGNLSIPEVLDLSLISAYAALVQSGFPLRDTPVPRCTLCGSAWIVFGYYTWKVIGVYLIRPIPYTNLISALEQRPERELEGIKGALLNMQGPQHGLNKL